MADQSVALSEKSLSLGQFREAAKSCISIWLSVERKCPEYGQFVDECVRPFDFSNLPKTEMAECIMCAMWLLQTSGLKDANAYAVLINATNYVLGYVRGVEGLSSDELEAIVADGQVSSDSKTVFENLSTQNILHFVR